MSTVEANETAVGFSAETLLIDTDVHELFTSKHDLLPYLDPVWQRYITDYPALFPGVQAPSAQPYAVPTPGPGSRMDWVLPAGVKHSPVVDLEALRKNLFEGEGVSIAILCGVFYPSNMLGNYELAQAMAAAYNDWQIEHWLDKEPRLRGSVHVVAHEPEVAAREIDRVGGHPQIVQVHIPNTTYRQYGDPFYRPIFEAAIRNDLVVALHHDFTTQTAIGFPRYFIEWHNLASRRPLPAS